MNCVSCDICEYHLGLFAFFPGVSLSSRVTCLLRALARKPFGDRNEKVMCVDLWTDGRRVTSLTNWTWSRHFVTLPIGRTYEELPR